MALAERVLAPLSRMRAVLAASATERGQAHVLHRASTSPPPQPIAHGPTRAPEDVIAIPCPDPTAEESARDLHQNRGLHLARQEEWSTLAADLSAADADRAKTDGGMPLADLIAFGARADVVAAAEHALVSGRPAQDAPLLDGIEALEAVLGAHEDDPMIAAIVANAHMDIGWAWRGTGWDIEVPMPNREAFAAHFERAGDILAPFSETCQASALLASARCAHNVGARMSIGQVVEDFETWIVLDPRNPRSMRSFGTRLLPRWHGSYDRLEAEARRMAGLTHDVWGRGAYAWIMMDAISTDTTACARLDLDFFIEGLRDILRNTHDQHIANLLAAYCAQTMGATPTGYDEADYVRCQIAEAAGWIVRDHLRELHPMLWAQATRGPSHTMRIRCRERFASAGHTDALRVISDMFHREIASGHRIVFTPRGAEARPA